jgi:hypothetical protein
VPLTLNQVFPGLLRKWFLKLQNSTRERLRQNKPSPFAEPPLGAQDHSLINDMWRRREKNALRQLQTSNDQ